MINSFGDWICLLGFIAVILYSEYDRMESQKIQKMLKDKSKKDTENQILDFIQRQVSQSSLKDRHISGFEDVIHILFEIDNFTPMTLQENGLQFQDVVMREMISDWTRKYQELQMGKISNDEYLEWKMQYQWGADK